MGFERAIIGVLLGLLLSGCQANFDYDFTGSGDGSVGNDALTGDCGDGWVEGAEACDDGNQSAGDGCSATCQVENGWSCSGGPSVCVQGCRSQGDACLFGGSCCSALCVDGACAASCTEHLDLSCSDDGSRDYLSGGVCTMAGCYRQIEVTHPSAANLTVDIGTEISWTNAAVPNGDLVTYDVAYSDDSGENWTTIVSDYGLQTEDVNGRTSWQETSAGAQSHPFEIRLPKVAQVIEASLTLTPVPASSTALETLGGHCEAGFSNSNLLTDAQAFDSDMGTFNTCEVPYATENGMIHGNGWMTFRFQNVNLSNADVDVDVTTYRFQSNGVDNWGVYASSDNSSWTLCGGLIPGANDYTSHSRTCTGFTGATLYVRVLAESSGSNAANGISFLGVSYPTGLVHPTDVSLVVAGDPSALFTQAGDFTAAATTPNFADALNAHLASAPELASETVTVPFELLFTGARVNVDSILIEYTDCYWPTDEVASGTYRVRVSQVAGAGAGAFDISDHDFQIAH